MRKAILAAFFDSLFRFIKDLIEKRQAKREIEEMIEKVNTEEEWKRRQREES